MTWMQPGNLFSERGKKRSSGTTHYLMIIRIILRTMKHFPSRQLDPFYHKPLTLKNVHLIMDFIQSKKVHITSPLDVFEPPGSWILIFLI